MKVSRWLSGNNDGDKFPYCFHVMGKLKD